MATCNHERSQRNRVFHEEQGVCAPFQVPQLTGPTLDKYAPKYLALKTSRVYTQNSRAIGNGHAFKELMCRLTCLKTQQKKQQFVKHLDLMLRSTF